MKKILSKIDGVWALALCSLLWSTGGLLIKFINASSFSIAGMRSFIALAVFMLILRRPPVWFVKNSYGAVDRRATFFMWLAGICYSATMILYCMANKLTTAANTILLQYTNPVYIILFGPLILGEKNSRKDYFTAAGVIAGIILFFAGDVQGGNLLGNVLAALSGVTFGFCTIFMRIQKAGGSQNSFMIAHFLTACFGLPFAVAQGGLHDGKSVAAIFAIGIFQMAFATLLYSKGIVRVKALSASIISMIEPLMNPVWVMIFAGEVPSLTCVIGGVIILGCILLREAIKTPQS